VREREGGRERERDATGGRTLRYRDCSSCATTIGRRPPPPPVSVSRENAFPLKPSAGSRPFCSTMSAIVVPTPGLKEMES
jgi:hypothetical protein